MLVVGEEVEAEVEAEVEGCSWRFWVVGGSEVNVFWVKEGEGDSWRAAVEMLGCVLAKRRWRMLGLWRRLKLCWWLRMCGCELITDEVVEGCSGSRMRCLWLLR